MANNDWMTVAVIALVVMVGIQMFGGVGSQAVTGGTGTGGGVVNVKVDDVSCNTATAPTATFNLFNKYNLGTALSGGTEATRVFQKNGDSSLVDRLQVVHGGTLSLSPKDELTVYAGENSTVYYTHKSTPTVPCEPSPVFENRLAQIDTAVNLTFFNDNDQVDTAQAISAGQTKLVQFKLQTVNNRAFGNPDFKGTTDKTRQNVVCLSFNSTLYVKQTITEVAVDSNSVFQPVLGTAGQPNTVNNLKFNALDRVSCTYVPVAEDNQFLRFKVEVEAHGTNSPGAIAAMTNVSVHDVDYDLDADTKAEIVGIQDEDNNDLGATDYLASPLLFS